MNKTLLIVSLIVLTGCSIGKTNSSSVFFGGEIVNPTDDYVVLYKGDEVIDSALLDQNNRFHFQLDTLSEGLHYFFHAPEVQYVFLEKGDSLQVRLNTIDFDESLVFSGIETGAQINNLMLELFLSQEEEQEMINKQTYDLEPEVFRSQIDSLRHLKLVLLNDLYSEGLLSDSAQEIAKASIDYTYFNYKEEYPFQHKKYIGKEVVQNLPSGFYDYRKNLSFSNPHLNYLRPYHDFMKAHIKNLSFAVCSTNCDKKGNVIRNQLHVNRHKLSLIDSLVEEKELKDNLFRNVAINYLLMANDSEENIETFISDFHLRSANNRHIEEIDDLYQGIRNIQPRKKIPNIGVTDIEGNKVSLQEISKDGKVVFYFWTTTDKKHFKNIVEQQKQLSNNYKDYTFVGINIRSDDTSWKGMIENAGLDKSLQYKANDYEEIIRSLAISHLNKCIITENATILDAFSDLYTASL
jgi:hypothetical protein